MKKKIHFLRPGKFTDHNGKEVEIKDTTLAEIIEATKGFNYQNDEFPLCIGHPQTDSPAFGYVNKNEVLIDGDFLAAEVDDEKLNPDFLTMLKDKLYSTVSVALRKDKSIKHLGFLGATPPAVTGLPSFAFAEEDGDFDVELSEYEVSSWYFKNLQTLFRGIKNNLIETDGLEKANGILPDYLIDELGEAPKIYEKAINEIKAFAEKVTEKENVIEQLNNSIQANQTTYNTLLAEKNQLISEVNQYNLTKKREAAVAFCEGSDIKMKIKDGEREGIIQTILQLEDLQPIEFAEGETTKKISALDMFKESIKARQDVVELGEHTHNGNSAGNTGDIDVSEFAERNVDPERLELHKQVLKMQQNENLSYQDALKKVINKK